MLLPRLPSGPMSRGRLKKFVVGAAACAAARGAAAPEEAPAVQPGDESEAPAAGEANDPNAPVYRWALRELEDQVRRRRDGAEPWEGPWNGKQEATKVAVSYERKLDKRGVVQLRDDDAIAMMCYDEIYKYGLCLWDAGLGYAPSYSYSYNDYDDDDAASQCAFILSSSDFSCAMYCNPDWDPEEDDAADTNAQKKKKKKKKKKKNTEEVVKEDDLLEPVAFCGSTFFAAFDCQYTARCGTEVLCSAIDAAPARVAPGALALGAAGALAAGYAAL